LLEERELTGRIALLRFYLRRILRLFPALVAVSVASLIYATIWLDHGQAVRAVHDLFAATTYRMNWVEALHEQPPFGLLDHTWSLSIEEQFYVLWPLGLLLAYRLGRGRGVFVAAIGGAVLSAGLRATLWHDGQALHRVYYGLDTHADGLLLGCALAALTLYRPKPMREGLQSPAGRAAGPVALALLAVAASQTALFSKGLSSWGYPVIGVLTVMVVADVWAGGLLERLLRPAPLVAVGRISYGLYLWHWPVFLVLNPTRTGWSGAMLTTVRLLVTAAVAVVSFFAIEQPFLRLKTRFEPAGRTSEPTFDPQPEAPADPASPEPIPNR